MFPLKNYFLLVGKWPAGKRKEKEIFYMSSQISTSGSESISSFLKEYLDFTGKLERSRKKILRYLKAKEKYFNITIIFLLLNQILSLNNRSQNFVSETEAKRET